jgi:hypothetical protein
MDPRCISDDKPVLWLGDGAGKVSIFLTLLVLMCFCNHEDPAKLMFKSVDGLRGDHAVEACQFVVEGDQHVRGCIAFGECHCLTASLVVGVFWLRKGLLENDK